MTKLRETFSDMAVGDLYEYKTAAKLAPYLAAKYNNNDHIRINLVSAAKRTKPTWIRSVVCSIIQVFVLIILSGIIALEYLMPFIFFHVISRKHRFVYACLSAYAVFVIVPLLRLLLVVMIKWIVIGSYKEGEFSLWSTMYRRPDS